MTSVVVLVTHLNDRRAQRAILSAWEQDLPPKEVVVADGGSSPEYLEPLVFLSQEGRPLRIVHAPGSVAQSRSLALSEIEGDVVAFLDTDEMAPPGWLRSLVRPIVEGRADFSGGPTRPLQPPRSRIEEYVNLFDAWFYERIVPEDLTSLPMGNSAWRIDSLRSIGGFDPSFVWGGEDFDVNLRAIRGGLRGVFVPEAWVFHDQSHLSSLEAFVRRRYRYALGASLAYLKNGVLGEKLLQSFRVTSGFFHPLGAMDWVVKPAALLSALVLWSVGGALRRGARS